MASRKTTKASSVANPISQPRPAKWDYTDSVFWKRIEQQHDSALKASIEGMVAGAKELAARVAGELPTFTKHDDTHLTNVLYWMEAFATPEALDEMGVVGCAFCILLAYTHDLGMVPDPGWRERVARDAADGSEDRQRLESWCAQHHPDLLALVERLLTDGEKPSASERERARWIEVHLQNDYLRATHADADARSRVAKHLERLDQTGSLKHGFGFIGATERAIELLTWMAASHNQGAAWLREKTDKTYPGGKFRAGLADANILLPAYLLRLADIADFDRTRAPTVVFHQLGLEEFSALHLVNDAVPEEKARTLGFSASEWMKHLAIDRWSWDGDELVYVASACRHPAIHQGIVRFVRLIETEVGQVREELSRAFPSRPLLLRLPGRVKADITTCGYHYEDLNFNLQAHEVTQLLMGTSLYGERELCLRELLQNALDSVQLRDRRWQLRKKLTDAAQPMPAVLGPSAFWTEGTAETPGEKELPIRVTWGRDEAGKREWIAVEDFGTGMTLEQLKTYFAALGRSFYKSPGYTAEARVLREHGFPVEAISQFGIGVLSCFMVAEWMEVETLACGEQAEALWVRITGPGALFHIQRKGEPGARSEFRTRPGTKVTLHLKRDIHLVELSEADFLTQARRDLGYHDGLDVKAEEAWLERQGVGGEREKDGETWLNPGAVVVRHVIWPRHAVGLRMPWGADKKSAWFRLDEATHFRVLAPIDQGELRKTATRAGLKLDVSTEVIWWTWDWQDDHAELGTGSRIRVVLPLPCGESRADVLPALGDKSPDYELAGLVEGQAPNGARERLLVRGMRVEDAESMDDPDLAKRLGAGLGSLIWIDLAGGGAPRLTADRKTAQRPVGREERQWRATLDALWGRWKKALLERINRDEGWAGWPLIVRLADSVGAGLPETISTHSQRMEVADVPSGAWSGRDGSQRLANASRWLALECSRDRPLARDRNLAWVLGLAGASAHALDHGRDFVCGFVSAFADDFACEFANDFAHALAFTFTLKWQDSLGKCSTRMLECHLLNEGFWPDLRRAFPLLRLPAAAERLNQAHLAGPALVEWGESAECARGYADYDVVSPFTAVAGPAWRARFPAWEKDREWRTWLLLPVLFADYKLAGKWSGALKRMADEKAEEADETYQELNEREKRWNEGVRRLRTESLFVFIPRPELWEKPFAEWTVADEATAGYSALYDIAEGKLYFAVGVVRSRDEMRKPEREVNRFLKDKQGELAAFRQRCPELFEQEEPREE